jgi:copper chaperone
MEQLALTAPDISCDHCKHTIEEELGAVPGVQSVSVEVPSKHVSVSFDPASTSEATIMRKLDEAGYPASA